MNQMVNQMVKKRNIIGTKYLRYLVTHPFLRIASCSFVIAIASCSNSQIINENNTAKNSKTVAVTQIVELPALNAVRDGLKEELATQGFEADKNLKWQWASAQGNQSTAVQIAKKFAGEDPDVIVAISTPSAQAVVSATQKAAPKTAIVFSAVVDPVKAKLISNLQQPGDSITGISTLTPVAEHLKLITQITPKVKRIGVISNAGEANSAYLVELLKQAASMQGLEIVESSIANSSEVPSAAKSLVGRADAIYAPQDNTVLTALESIIQVGVDNQMPIYAGDTDSVEKGAIATLSFDYQNIGQQTGRIVARILEGEKPGTIAVETPEEINLVINSKSAATMGVEIPAELLKTANLVIE